MEIIKHNGYDIVLVANWQTGQYIWHCSNEHDYVKFDASELNLHEPYQLKEHLDKYIKREVNT